MKLVRYGPPRQEKPGVLDSNGRMRDLSGIVVDIAAETLSPESLASLRGLDLTKLPIVTDETRFGPCVGRVGKFICIGLNYSDHAAETGMKVPSEPVVFMKATSALCGANDDIVIPRGGQRWTGRWSWAWSSEHLQSTSVKAMRCSISPGIVLSMTSRNARFSSTAPGNGLRGKVRTHSVPSGRGWLPPMR